MLRGYICEADMTASPCQNNVSIGGLQVLWIYSVRTANACIVNHEGWICMYNPSNVHFMAQSWRSICKYVELVETGIILFPCSFSSFEVSKLVQFIMSAGQDCALGTLDVIPRHFVDQRFHQERFLPNDLGK